MTEKKLTTKQQRFVLEYLVDGNATAAAQRAGYSARTAHQQGYENMQNPAIKAAIDAAEGRRAKRVEAKGDRVLKELETFAYSDLAEAFNENGTLKHPKDFPEALRRAVKSFEVEELFEGSGQDKLKVGRTVKVTLWPKDKGLELLGRNQKLFTDKVEHSVSESLAELLGAARGGEAEE